MHLQIFCAFFIIIISILLIHFVLQKIKNIYISNSVLQT